MTLAFILRVEFDSRGWRLTLLDLTSGERQGYSSFESCIAAVRARSEHAVARAPHPPLQR